MGQKAQHKKFCQTYLQQRGTVLDENRPDNFRIIWQKVIPEVAIILQFFYCIFNVVFQECKRDKYMSNTEISVPWYWYLPNTLRVWRVKRI